MAKGGRAYTVPYAGTITNAGGNTDLIYLLPADDKPIALDSFKFANYSEVAEAQEEGLSITVYRFTATVTVGSGGSAITPTPDSPNDTAAGFTARANDTTVATTSGASTIADELGEINRNSPAEWVFDEPIIAVQGQAILIRLNTIVADDMSAAFSAKVRELS